MKVLNVNKLTRSGVTFKFWCVQHICMCDKPDPEPPLTLAQSSRVADWFAQLNNKMGGDLKKIQVVGQYMVEIWKAVGMERIGDKVSLCLAWRRCLHVLVVHALASPCPCGRSSS